MPSYPLKRDGRILHVKFENLSISLETGFLQQGNTLYREQIQVNYFHYNSGRSDCLVSHIVKSSSCRFRTVSVSGLRCMLGSRALSHLSHDYLQRYLLKFAMIRTPDSSSFVFLSRYRFVGSLQV